MPKPTVSYADCQVCLAYAARRSAVLAPHFDSQALRRSVDAGVVVREYLHRVHRRHLAGRTLSTRRSTEPFKQRDGDRSWNVITVQRACNGCGESLGDATPAELATAASGDPLPDVRLECGCHGSPRDRSAA